MLVTRKPVFRVSDQVRHKSGCTATEHGKILEISDLNITYVAKANAMISCAVTMQLIYVFVFSHMHKSGFLMTWLNSLSDTQGGRTGAVVRTSDYGPRGPWFEPRPGTVRCGLEQVTFYPCLVLVKSRKRWTYGRHEQTVTRLGTTLCLIC